MIWNTQPYNFDLANKTLDKFFAKLIEKESDFVLENIGDALRTNKLYFNSNSQICFKDLNGEVHELFIYKYDYGVTKFSSLPSKHYFKCSTIDEMIENGKFEHYRASESSIVKIFDWGHGIISKQSNQLPFCTNCFKFLHKLIENIKLEYKEELSRHNVTDDKNIYGYSLEWKRLSREYRKKQNFQCEECGVQIHKSEDKQYIHTHHIDGDKSNNNDSNLRCLCIVCHSFVDENHKKRFNDKGGKQKTKQEFINKYRSELEGYYTFS